MSRGTTAHDIARTRKQGSAPTRLRSLSKPTTDRRIGKHVRITGGMKEFIGQTGVIVDVEKDGWQKLYRVELDDPVDVPMVGRITDDLWEGRFLKTIR
jgi:hypothetical protein